MNRLLLIFIFLFTSTIIFAQNAPFRFKVLDEKTNEAISYCYLVVKGKSTSVQADQAGMIAVRIEMTDTLVIYQVGYFLKRIAASEIIKNMVFLKSKNLVLEEVTITSRNIDTLQNNNNIVFLDFDFYDDFILALVNKGKKRNVLWLLDLNGNRIVEKVLNIKTEIIFKDCFENIHLISDDSLYQIYYDYQNISLLPPFHISSYNNFLKPCECHHGNSTIFKAKTYRQLKNTYWLYNNKEKTIMASVADSSAIRGFNMDYNINYFLGIRRQGMGYGTSVTEIYKNIDKYREELVLPQSYTSLLSGVESELKRIDSNFVLFDYTNNLRYTFSMKGVLLERIDLNNFSKISPQLNIDYDSKNYIFSSLNQKGELCLYKYDQNKNNFTHKYEIGNFYFIKNFKIKENFIYFINKEKGGDFTKTKIIKKFIVWTKI